jgi:hypothetical protein
MNKTNATTLRQLYDHKSMRRTVKVICNINDVRDVKDIIQFCIEYGMDGILIKSLDGENKSQLRDFVNYMCYILDSLPYPYNFRWEIILDDFDEFDIDFDLNNESKIDLNFDLIKKNTFNSNNGYICIEWSKNVKNIVEKYKVDKTCEFKNGLLCNKLNNISYPSSKFLSYTKDDKNEHDKNKNEHDKNKSEHDKNKNEHNDKSEHDDKNKNDDILFIIDQYL